MMYYSRIHADQNHWTASHRLQLKTGCNLRSPASGNASGWGPCGYAGPYTPEQQREMQACWEVYGASILEEYLRDRPGQRPWYWWLQQGMEIPEDERAALRKMEDCSVQKSR